MKIFQYLVKGQLYDQQFDLISQVKKLASDFNISIEIEENEDGFFIQTKSDMTSLLDFEPRLLRKLATLMNVTMYTKKEPTVQKVDEPVVQENEKPFKICSQHLRQEKIIAVKGTNSFHLVCNASKAKAVQTLRTIILQPSKPLWVMFKNPQRAEQLIQLSKKESEFLKTPKTSIVVSKIRNLHRLEKVKYKHKLTPLINPVNQRISLSLIQNDLYQKLFNEIEFPLVSIDAKTKDGKVISDKETLVQTYGDQVADILDADHAIDNPKPRDVFQIVYGKIQQIEPKIEVKKDKSFFNVSLDHKQSNIGSYKLKPLKMVLNNDGQQTLKHIALSLLFTKLSIEDILKLKLPFTTEEVEKLYENWQNGTNTFKSNSLITLFDAIASLSNELHEKSFTDESWMTAEAHYEVCEEDLFDYNIEENEIEIDIISSYLKNSKLKNLGSTLVNTVSSIIADIAKEQDLKVRLEGELFHFRDLSELTIEKLEDEDIEVELR